jgi:hypothetical protein
VYHLIFVLFVSAIQSSPVRKIFRTGTHVALVQFDAGAVMWAGKPRPYNVVLV